jgi:hypothetical protein
VHGALNQCTKYVLCLSYVLVLVLSPTPATIYATDISSASTVASTRLPPPSAATPVFVGEALLFEVRWMGMLAGRASMTVSERTMRDGREVYHIRTLAETSPFFSVFYMVRDVGETFVDARELYPWYFHLDQREGARAMKRTVAFDQHRGVAVYTKNHQAPEAVEVPLGVHDSLSSFYALRTVPLHVGQAIHLKTFSNGRTYDVEVQVIRRERVDAYWGPVEALVVRTLMRFEDVLRQKGDVLIWVTDDERRLPVRMRTAIKVGSIEATLVEAKSTP